MKRAHGGALGIDIPEWAMVFDNLLFLDCVLEITEIWGYGGGAAIRARNSTIHHCFFGACCAEHGFGLAFFNTTGSLSGVTFFGCVSQIENAGNGAFYSIYANWSSFSLEHNNFSYCYCNEADQGGSAIQIYRADCDVRFATFIGNRGPATIQSRDNSKLWITFTNFVGQQNWYSMITVWRPTNENGFLSLDTCIFQNNSPGVLNVSSAWWSGTIIIRDCAFDTGFTVGDSGCTISSSGNRELVLMTTIPIAGVVSPYAGRLSSIMHSAWKTTIRSGVTSAVTVNNSPETLASVMVYCCFFVDLRREISPGVTSEVDLFGGAIYVDLPRGCANVTDSQLIGCWIIQPNGQASDPLSSGGGASIKALMIGVHRVSGFHCSASRGHFLHVEAPRGGQGELALNTAIDCSARSPSGYASARFINNDAILNVDTSNFTKCNSPDHVCGIQIKEWQSDLPTFFIRYTQFEDLSGGYSLSTDYRGKFQLEMSNLINHSVDYVVEVGDVQGVIITNCCFINFTSLGFVKAYDSFSYVRINHCFMDETISFAHSLVDDWHIQSIATADIIQPAKTHFDLSFDRDFQCSSQLFTVSLEPLLSSNLILTPSNVARLSPRMIPLNPERRSILGKIGTIGVVVAVIGIHAALWFGLRQE
jgi:hypothetical protein